MKKNILLFTAFLLLFSTHVFSQISIGTGSVFNNQTPQHNGDGTTDVAIPELRDGNNTLGLTYNQTMCGLNYVQASAMTTTRYSPPGTGLPVSLNITGMPACAIVQQAYLYWIASTSSNDAGFTINGSPGTGTLIGTGPDKCWSMGATNHFRANVTANVTANGTYTVNVNSGANATDGVTLLVIYRDPSATYRGTMIIHDGCIVNTSGGTSSYNMTGINACGTGTNTSGFLIMGDNQNNITPPTHTVAAGATSAVFNNNFFNFDAVSPAVPAGLASMNFSNTPGGGDCYSIIAAGLYFRTTTCGPCTTGALTLTTSQTADNCSQCNGTASVTASGGSGTYSYTWSPAPGGGQGTATATGLCAGNYSVTVSDGGCNTQVANVTVTTTGTTPNTTITPAGPFCQNATAVNLTAATAGGTWSGTGITNATNGTFNPATAGPGNHTITYTIGGPCGGSSTTTITVNALVTPTFAAVGPVCSGATITLPTTSTNGITGTWSPAINNTATTTYTFTPNAGQCANTTTMTVTVNQVPTMTAPSNIAACPTDLIPASTFSSTPAGATFGWTNSNTGIGLGANGTGNTPSFSATNGTGSPISGTITVTPTLAGCIGNPVTYTITVNDLFDATITPAGPFCESGAAINLTAVDAGGTWSGTGITNASNGTFNPTTAGPGSHMITYTISGSCGSTDTETIVVNPDMDATITPAGPFCPGDAAVNLTGADAGGTWSGTGITNATNGTFDPTVAGTGSHTITYTIAGMCGDSQTTTIVINTLLDATINAAGPFCESSTSVNLTAATAGGTWSGTGITNAANGTFNPTTAGAGSHIITYTLPGSCGNTDTETIVVNPDMDATITAAGPFCTSDAALNLTSVDAGGTWTGTGITDGVNGTFDPATSGAGTFTITYTIGGMCGDVQTTNIIVSDQLDATITPAGPFCSSNGNAFLGAVDAGGTWSGPGIINATTGEFSPTTAGAGNHVITYTLGGSCGDVQTTTIQVIADADATINAAGPFCITDAAFTMTAAQSGGVWAGTGITSSANGTFDPNTAGAGTFTITYTISGACGDVDDIAVTVFDLIPSTITAAGPFCVDDAAVNLTAANAGGTWSGAGITNANNGTFDPSVAGAGSHVITYTISGSCGTSSTQTIVVNPLPVPTFTADVLSGCAPLTVVFTDNTNPAGTTSQWIMSDGFVSGTNGTVTNTFTNPGTYNVSLTLTSAQGCTGTTVINNMITVFPNPIADFTWGPTDATIVNPTINFSNTSTGASLYAWDFAGLGTSTATHPSFTFPDTSAASYQVCLIAATVNGCLDTTCQLVEINDEFLIYVPNAFTPDGDNINDYFKAYMNGHEVDQFELMIFNRWGELIFNAEDDNITWDGNHKGLPVQEDVYVWKINAKRTSDGKKFEFIGHVTLLR